MARDSDSPPDVGETCGEARAWRGPRRWAHGARYQVGEHMRSWIKRFEGHGCERREGAHLPCRCRRGGKGWEEVDMRPRVQQRPGDGWWGDEVLVEVLVEGISKKGAAVDRDSFDCWYAYESCVSGRGIPYVPWCTVRAFGVGR